MGGVNSFPAYNLTHTKSGFGLLIFWECVFTPVDTHPMGQTIAEKPEDVKRLPKGAQHPFGRGWDSCSARECERARWPKITLPRVDPIPINSGGSSPKVELKSKAEQKRILKSLQ
jgi:hypothetical protein